MPVLVHPDGREYESHDAAETVNLKARGYTYKGGHSGAKHAADVPPPAKTPSETIKPKK